MKISKEHIEHMRHAITGAIIARPVIHTLRSIK
jgi:hypothetical protein